MNAASYRLSPCLLIVIILLLPFVCGSSEGTERKQETATQAQPDTTQPVADVLPKLTRKEVIEARRKFRVQVLSFDATQEHGIEFPYSDYLTLRIKNGSKVTLPYLTVLTKRFDKNGRMIGSSRAPSIFVGDLKPGQSADVDYYPRGHLPYVTKITVQIETLISPDNQQFFPELPK